MPTMPRPARATLGRSGATDALTRPHSAPCSWSGPGNGWRPRAMPRSAEVVAAPRKCGTRHIRVEPLLLHPSRCRRRPHRAAVEQQRGAIVHNSSREHTGVSKRDQGGAQWAYVDRVDSVSHQQHLCVEGREGGAEGDAEGSHGRRYVQPARHEDRRWAGAWSARGTHARSEPARRRTRAPPRSRPRSTLHTRRPV